VQQIHDALVVLLRRQMYGAGLAGWVLRLWRSSIASRLLEAGSEQRPDKEPLYLSVMEHARGLESKETNLQDADEVTASCLVLQGIASTHGNVDASRFNVTRVSVLLLRRNVQ
jgi:hypothetical protein